jgi:aspartate/methionine/tyrosine aminotransferase
VAIPLSDRRYKIDSSGIRKVFDLAAKLKNPCNLSIGLPDYDIPEDIKVHAIEAIRAGKNRYTQTAGIPALREKVLQRYKTQDLEFDDLIITSGTSGGLVLTFLALLNPGDQVLFADPYFVMYKALLEFIGAVPRLVDTYPDFRLRREALEAAYTPACRMIIINSPNNPTGVVYTEEELRMVAEFAEEKNLTVLTDEIYEDFSYDAPFLSPARFTNPERTVLIGGMSKNLAMTGWRLGWVAAPKHVVAALTDIQQYTFVCAPSFAQIAALEGIDYPFEAIRQDYAGRRDLITNGLRALGLNVERPGGAFYIFPEAPGLDGQAFCNKCIEHELLLVPGNVFSTRNTHFRISFAASRENLQRGLHLLAEALKP